MSSLERLREDELRSQVLVPLFKTMEYNDVTERHGIDELGKDIVMWALDRMSIRVNTAVVVKRGAISGRASGASSSAATTATQIRQALGSTYRDPRSGQGQSVSQVFVVASGTISQQAQSAILSQLGTFEQRVVTFIDGGKLEELVDKHLGPRNALVHAITLQRALRDLETNHDVQVSVSKDGIRLQIRTPTEGQPLSGLIELDKLDSSKRAEIERLLDEHIRTGAPAVLRGVKVSAPELAATLDALGISAVGDVDVHLVSTPLPSMALLLRFEKEGDAATLGPFHCHVRAAGPEEIVFESTAASRGWSVRCQLDLRQKSMKADLTSSLAGLSATGQVSVLKARQLLARGPVLILEEFDRAIPLGRGIMPSGMIAAPEQILVDLAEAAALVEGFTGVLLPLPERPIERAEALALLEARQLLSNDDLEQPWNSASVTMSSVNPTAAAEFLKAGAHMLTIRQSVGIEVFGQRIELGEQETTLYSAQLDDSSQKRLQKYLRKASGSVKLTFVAAKAPGRAAIRLTRED